MAGYPIRQDKLTIRVTETGSSGDRLSCRHSRTVRKVAVDCPTGAYQKVASLSVDREANDAIAVRLVPQPGQRFDEFEIEARLPHTVAKARIDLPGGQLADDGPSK
jgi:hypothetical protein